MLGIVVDDAVGYGRDGVGSRRRPRAVAVAAPEMVRHGVCLFSAMIGGGMRTAVVVWKIVEREIEFLLIYAAVLGNGGVKKMKLNKLGE